jgi:uncharacterized protein (DUF983 family)
MNPLYKIYQLIIRLKYKGFICWTDSNIKLKCRECGKKAVFKNPFNNEIQCHNCGLIAGRPNPNNLP